jgi:hypothetical protein
MKKLVLFGSLFLLISCSTQLYVPIDSVNSVSLADLKTGRETYVNKCASCHQLYLPNKYTEKVWMNNLNEMQVRAKITDHEKQLIYQYLTSTPEK